MSGDRLNINRVVIRGNANTGGSTPGILAAGNNVANVKSTITDSTIANNNNLAGGGNAGGALTLTQGMNLKMSGSLIANNTNNSGGPASALYVLANALTTSVDIRNTTISGNTTGSGSVITDEQGATSFSYDTIVGNTATTAGTAIIERVAATGMTFKGTIVSGSLGAGGSVAPCKFVGVTPPTSLGFNYDAGTTCKFLSVNDHQSTPVTLGPLADNGGRTFTHAIPAGSPLIDTGGVGGCSAADATPLTSDQRGTARPQGAGCEPGAFEFVPPTDGGGGGGGGDGGGDGGGGATDTTPPGESLSGKRTQDVDKLAITVTADEAGTVSGQATVSLPGARKVVRSRAVTVQVTANQKTKLRFKFAKKTLRAIKKSIAHGKHLKAKVAVTATDAAQNSSSANKTVRLTN